MLKELNKTLGAISLAALCLSVSACDENAEMITRYQFCGEIGYIGEQGFNADWEFYDVSFHHVSLYEHDGEEVNLSVRTPYLDYYDGGESGLYNGDRFDGCSPVITLPKPLPARFFMGGHEPIRTWAVDVNGNCYRNIEGTISVPVDEPDLVVVHERYDRVPSPTECQNYEFPAGWPDSAVPEVVELASPPAKCKGDLCLDSNTLSYFGASGVHVETYSLVDEPTPEWGEYDDAQRVETLRLENGVLLAAPGSFWLSPAASAVSAKVLPWSEENGQPAVNPAKWKTHTPAYGNDYYREVACIGSICAGQTAKLADGSGTALVGQLFGDFFRGKALAIVTREFVNPTIALVSIEELEQSE